MTVTGIPNRRHRLPDPRSAVTSEGTIGGPCHTIKADGWWCMKKATMIATDGYGYCTRHGRDKTPA